MSTSAPVQSPMRVQAWIPPELAEQLRRRVAEERRSISSVVRNALEDSLRERGDGRG